MNIKALRESHGLTQAEFWEPMQVSQSAGSRYERGVELPWALQMIIRLKFVECLQIEDLTLDEWSVARYLREREPTVYSKYHALAKPYRTNAGEAKVK